MRELAFALIRVVALVFGAAQVLPVLTWSLSILILEAPNSSQTGTRFWIALSAALVQSAVFLLLFVFARPIARIAVPDVPVPGASLDLFFVRKASLVVIGIFLIAQASEHVAALISLAAEWANLPSTVHADYAISSIYASVCQALVGALFLYLGHRS